jgi:predicted permease
MSSFLKDLRFGLRMLAKKPGFTAVAVITLALGIGANSAIFSVVNGLLLSPLPYRDSERLVIIWSHSPGANVAQDWPSPGQYSAVKSQNTTFEEVAIALGNNVVITGKGIPTLLGGLRVSSNMFSLLGAQPELGRAFLPEEDVGETSTTVILSNGFWQQRFGGDPNVLGQPLTLNGQLYTVVGVMPADFSLGEEVVPTSGFGVKHMEVLLPLPLNAKAMNRQDAEYYNVLARLKDGATVEQAQADLDAVVNGLEQQFPDQYPASRRFSLSVKPLLEQVVGDVRLALLVLLGAVGCVLLIACANVANLLLARAAAREKEMAIRTALGAGRWRVVRQLLTESVILALMGGVLGLLIAIWSLYGLRWLNPGNIPRLQNIGVDGRVLAFTLGAALLTSLLFGLAPALRGSRVSLNETLKEGGRNPGGSGSHRLRNLLVIAEIALSLPLLIGAGLLIRSFVRVQQVEPGFAAQNVFSLRLAVIGTSYADQSRRLIYYQQLWERIRQMPGVESVGGTSSLPFGGITAWTSITIEGYDTASGQGMIQADSRIASVGYFETMKIPLIAGRFFNDQDTKDSMKVAIIDQNMARSYWPNADPLGKRFKMGGANSDAPWLTVVGVVGDIKQYALDAGDRVSFYWPHQQAPALSMYVTVRTVLDAPSQLAAVTATARSIDDNVTIYDVKTMEQRLSDSLARRRFAMLALGLFAVVAMVLAAVGIYGVMSYSVTQRTREIGIRMALGASPRDVLKLVVGQGMLLAAIGVCIGLASAFAATRLMANLLFGVSATDPATFVIPGFVLASVALLACYVPARRAARVDPMVALRNE